VPLYAFYCFPLSQVVRSLLALLVQMYEYSSFDGRCQAQALCCCLHARLSQFTYSVKVQILTPEKLLCRRSTAVCLRDCLALLGQNYKILTHEKVLCRLHTAVCMRDCELVKISTQNFETICAQHPHVALKLIQAFPAQFTRLSGTKVQILTCEHTVYCTPLLGFGTDACRCMLTYADVC
jgi:hypothetical protein